MTWQRDESDTAVVSHETVRPAARLAGRSGARSKANPAARPHAANRQEFVAPRANPAPAERDQPNRNHEGYLIKELQQLLRTQIEARMRARGLWLSFPHSAVLMTLTEEPGLSGAQLARRCSVTAQTMNGLLMPLEKKGLIERRPDPENARVLRCYLKAKGTSLMQQGMNEASAVFKLMLGALSTREREEFRSILRRCVQALQENAEHVAHADIAQQIALTKPVRRVTVASAVKRKPKK